MIKSAETQDSSVETQDDKHIITVNFMDGSNIVLDVQRGTKIVSLCHQFRSEKHGKEFKGRKLSFFREDEEDALLPGSSLNNDVTLFCCISDYSMVKNLRTDHEWTNTALMSIVKIMKHIYDHEPIDLLDVTSISFMTYERVYEIDCIKLLHITGYSRRDQRDSIVLRDGNFENKILKIKYDFEDFLRILNASNIVPKLSNLQVFSVDRYTIKSPESYNAVVSMAKQLYNCQYLQVLNLDLRFDDSMYNNFSDLDLINIVEGCSQLREVSLLSCSWITDKSIVYLVDGCKWLTTLTLSDCCISDKSIEYIMDTPRITSLYVEDCPYVSWHLNGQIK